MGGGNSRELTGTTSGCTAHHTPVRWRLCAVKQLELIPGLFCASAEVIVLQDGPGIRAMQVRDINRYTLGRDRTAPMD